MYKKNGCLYFSPSDLTRYMESPFASWMDRFAIEAPDLAPDKDPADPLMGLLQSKGYAYEDAFEAEFDKAGRFSWSPTQTMTNAK